MIHNVDPQLSQWDVGRVVSISNSNATHIHFANQGDSKAVIIEIKDGSAKVPDYLLQTGKTVIAYAVYNGVTLESKSFAVRKREKPESYVYEDDQRNYIYKLITDAESAVVGIKQAIEDANEAANSANNATAKADLAAQNSNDAATRANEAATKASNAAKNMMVVREAKGEKITLNDAIEQNIVGLRIFGKTTQDGIPTPDTPVDLDSAGDFGSIEVMLHGGNIAESVYATNELELYNNALFIETTLLPSTTYTLSFRGTTGNTYYANEKVFDQVWVAVQAGTTTLVLTTKSTLDKGVDTQYQAGRGWIILKNYKKNATHVFSSVMLNLGSSAKEYEAPKGKQATSLTQTLRAVPVTDKAFATYTDASGISWCADEIDFARGIYVKRIHIVGFAGAVGLREKQPASGDKYRFSFYFEQNPTFFPSATTSGMCNALTFNSSPIDSNNLDNAVIAYHRGGIFVRCDAHKTVDEFVAWAIDIGLRVQYVLAEPIEIPLSAEELAAYYDLHTHKGNTTVFNSASAYMDLEYVMDARKYIDGLVTGTILPATVE